MPQITRNTVIQITRKNFYFSDFSFLSSYNFSLLFNSFQQKKETIKLNFCSVSKSENHHLKDLSDLFWFKVNISYHISNLHDSFVGFKNNCFSTYPFIFKYLSLRRHNLYITEVHNIKNVYSLSNL